VCVCVCVCVLFASQIFKSRFGGNLEKDARNGHTHYDHAIDEHAVYASSSFHTCSSIGVKAPINTPTHLPTHPHTITRICTHGPCSHP